MRKQVFSIKAELRPDVLSVYAHVKPSILTKGSLYASLRFNT